MVCRAEGLCLLTVVLVAYHIDILWWGYMIWFEDDVISLILEHANNCEVGHRSSDILKIGIPTLHDRLRTFLDRQKACVLRGQH